jgi:hypothetical protein
MGLLSDPPRRPRIIREHPSPCALFTVEQCLHRFYSWRRYCNKHQIRLGGYSMDLGDAVTPQEEGEQEQSGTEQQLRVSTGPGIIAAAQQRLQEEGNQPRNRSPTPPRALFRSTTGKGVAFTEQDVTFLVRFMDYRKWVQCMGDNVHNVHCPFTSIIDLRIVSTW